ncbi:hypothetical protein KO494_12375 [Lacinutrix sp. C3R15]|uniref:hypothetical protein n=1 Tax=Flavobacteriaceae TaxID=49546 RepID=UPI001C09B662|nr:MULTISPECIES: hypothetical protein [Flavobacteriaceae]MBU2940333.1 hypothetical protein [Lacinutrix sp. C3R15]MDO6623653.1 hypothetical protein [Oceanihabitans sp. 1_MG-2023]
MKNVKKYDYLLVLLGSVAAIYAQAGAQQNTLLLVLGIVFLMFGLYRIYSTIPSKKEEEKNEF